jgi:hypothetical protein
MLPIIVAGAVVLALFVQVGVWASARSAAEASQTQTEVRAQAAEVYVSFAGTIDQRNAGFVMRAFTFNHAMDECMDAAGYPEWDWSLSRNYASETDPLASGVWLAEPNRSIRSDALIAQRLRLLADDEMNQDSMSEKEMDAVRSCVESAPTVSENEAEAATTPPVAQKLIQEWHKTIGAYAQSTHGEGDYYACVDEASLDVLRATGLGAEDLGQALSALDPSNAAIPTPEAKEFSTEWKDFLAAEKAITDVDWNCRKDVYADLIGRLGPVVDEFAEAHSVQIAEAKRGGRQIEAAAAELGYAGQPGSLQ